jgi:DNA-binding NarL/FixJ family response regulator
MIRVLVVEEVRAIGETLATVLRSEADIEVVGYAASLDETVPHVGACGVVLVNSPRQPEAATRLIQAVRKLAPKVKVVVMGLARSQAAILQCIEAGVAGYVLKDSPLSELLKHIRAAHNNETLVSPPIAAALMSYVADLVGFEPSGSHDSAAPQSLTRREREVLTLVRQGLTNQEIAEALVIELGTVKNHVHNILRKLNVNSRRDAVHVSRLAGLWGLDETSGWPSGRVPVRRPLYAATAGAST